MGTYVEDVGDQLVIWDSASLPLFDERFEFGECQGGDFLSGRPLVLLPG